MPTSYFAFALSLAVLINICSAGMQVPILIVNISPYDVVVDMDVGNNCIYTDFNPDDLKRYYNSWESNNLRDFDPDYAPYNNYLQQYKSQMGVPKLDGFQAPSTGATNIPALDFNATDLVGAPYRVFEYQTKGSGDCASSHSAKTFALHVNGETEQFTVEHPPTSEWTLTRDSPDSQRVIHGPGGYARPALVALEAATLVAAVVTVGAGVAVIGAVGFGVEVTSAWAETSASIELGVFGSTAGLSATLYGLAGSTFLGFADLLAEHFNTNAQEKKPQNGSVSINQADFNKPFDAIYSTLDDDHRKACVMGKNIMGNYDCLVAGTSLLVQGNGKALAVPLPNIYRAFNF